jgi:RHH-type rel operon transcriptional repressor/antitoxin RelB
VLAGRTQAVRLIGIDAPEVSPNDRARDQAHRLGIPLRELLDPVLRPHCRAPPAAGLLKPDARGRGRRVRVPALPRPSGRVILVTQEEPVLTVRLPADLEKRLERLARTTGRSKSYYVREALLQYLEDLEDYHVALKRLEEHLPGIPLEEVARRLGLED